MKQDGSEIPKVGELAGGTMNRAAERGLLKSKSVTISHESASFEGAIWGR